MHQEFPPNNSDGGNLYCALRYTSPSTIPDDAAIDEAVPAEVLTAALYTRFRSRQEHTFAEKMLSAMRQKFGGHVELKAKQ